MPLCLHGWDLADHHVLRWLFLFTSRVLHRFLRGCGWFQSQQLSCHRCPPLRDNTGTSRSHHPCYRICHLVARPGSPANACQLEVKLFHKTA